jgi:hypothetical protein
VSERGLKPATTYLTVTFEYVVVGF